MTTDDEPVLRCPKCRSQSFLGIVVEEIEQAINIFDGKKQGVFSESAMPNREGSHGSCGCGHKWRFRDKWAI